MKPINKIPSDTNLRKLLLAIALLGSGAILLSACDSNEGTMENVGESLDEAGEEIQDEIDDHTDDNS